MLAMNRARWRVLSDHPLRDDPRSDVAIRKLRRWLQDDPVRARRVVTREGGYALGRGEPFRWIALRILARGHRTDARGGLQRSPRGV